MRTQDIAADAEGRSRQPLAWRAVGLVAAIAAAIHVAVATRYG